MKLTPALLSFSLLLLLPCFSGCDLFERNEFELVPASEDPVDWICGSVSDANAFCRDGAEAFCARVADLDGDCLDDEDRCSRADDLARDCLDAEVEDLATCNFLISALQSCEDVAE
ncbi:MAG: hypothetical protein AAFV53_36535 [Myxococcota bacterium]